MLYHILFDKPHNAGDAVCFLSACFEFSRKTGHTVYVDECRDIVEAYKSPNFLFGNLGARMVVDPRGAHRSMRPDYYGNYYGTYLASMGLYDGTPARPVLPVFEKMSSLCVIQPFSNYARNPPVAYIQAVVDIFRELSGEEVYVIGLPTTERILKNVRYDLLATSLPRLMQIVQNARIVLTPRSLSAHVAAGYGTPSVVWCPNDKENWHLDYPNWSRETRLYEDGVDAIRDAIVKVWDIVKKFDISS